MPAPTNTLPLPNTSTTGSGSPPQHGNPTAAPTTQAAHALITQLPKDILRKIYKACSKEPGFLLTSSVLNNSCGALAATSAVFPNPNTKDQPNVQNIKNTLNTLLQNQDLTELKLDLSQFNETDATQIIGHLNSLEPSPLLKRLTSLHINSQFLTPGQLVRLLHKLRNLKTLDLSSCSKLTQLPDTIGNLINLHTLNLDSCSALTTLPNTIGELTNLKTLDLDSCSALTTLPNTIGELTNLNTLDLSWCSNLAQLPDTIGKLTNLNTLYLGGSCTTEISPNTIGKLTNLKTLNLSNRSNLTQLPDTIGNLKNLHTLNLEECNALTTLPNTIGVLKNLHTLDLWCCKKLTTLPQSMAQLTQLNTLAISATLANSNHEIFQHLKLEDLTLLNPNGIKVDNLKSLLNTQSNLQSLTLWNDGYKQSIGPFVELLSAKGLAHLKLKDWLSIRQEQLNQLLAGLKKPNGSTERPSLTVDRSDLIFMISDEGINALKELGLGF